MQLFWTTAEVLDLALIRLLDRADRLLKRPAFAERVDRATGRTPEPTAAPKSRSNLPPTTRAVEGSAFDGCSPHRPSVDRVSLDARAVV